MSKSLGRKPMYLEALFVGCGGNWLIPPSSTPSGIPERVRSWGFTPLPTTGRTVCYAGEPGFVQLSSGTPATEWLPKWSNSRPSTKLST
ncbi:MAG: hypothetical protein ACRDEA_02190, partial [Microcystaceae cyanobacterium]